MGRSRQRWGWHQLDAEVARRLVRDAGVPAGALVLDIGAGHGAITAPLVAAGHRVIAIELHAGRARHLERRFGERITVARADAGDLRLPRREFHVVANPPYSVTTAVLRRLLHPGSRLLTAHLVLPTWAAQRWTASNAPGAGRWRRRFQVETGPFVPRKAFRPAPRGDSQVLVIRRR